MTFNTRGVAVPFTTPFLLGARVRAAVKVGSELVLPNTSGNRSVYIVPWDHVRDFCQPSVHDTILARHIAALSRIDPANIRQAALAVAVEGYAGHDAAKAAEQALAAERTLRSTTQAQIVGELVRQVDPTCQHTTVFAEGMQLDPRARAVLHRIATSLGGAPAALEKALIGINEAFLPIGVARDDKTARLPRQIDLLKRTFIHLSRWLEIDPGNDVGGLGQVMAIMLKTTVLASQMVMGASRNLLRDPVVVLKRWMKNPDDIIAAASRADWLLDGWERVCLMWLAENTNPSRRGTLLEMVQLLPVLPIEARDWPDMANAYRTLSQSYHVTSHSDAWRSGSAALGMIRRNELSRARSL